MAIFVNEHTKVIVQGLTGGQGKFHGLRNRAYGTNVVGGVTPGKGGQDVEGIPVFDSVADAVKATGADASFVAVPPKAAPAAILEAAAAGVRFIVCITEGVPAQDEARVYATLKRDFPNTRLLGPNCPGIISPGRCNIGITAGEIAQAPTPGGKNVGIESGTATGWMFTDWVEDMMLRLWGGDVYDQWITNEVKFDDERVIEVYLGR